MLATSLKAASPLPLVQPRSPGQTDVAEFIADERDALVRQLHASGTLLLRGWQLGGVEHLVDAAKAFSAGAPLFSYAGGASPRSALGEGSYTSTEYPAELELALHNELSYADLYPSRLFFLCLVEPRDRGETTFGDSRRILAAIDAPVADRFRRKQLRYIRHLSPVKGSGYSWQEALETEDEAVADRRCRQIGADVQWCAGGVLRLSQLRPATAVHPVTGEEVWFNQADGFHPSALDPRTYSEQLALCGSEDRFRLNVTYGDGSPIEPEALAHVRSVIRRETIAHRWLRGDLVIADNLLAAHGRKPFSGPRQIALAMS